MVWKDWKILIWFQKKTDKFVKELPRYENDF